MRDQLEVLFLLVVEAAVNYQLEEVVDLEVLFLLVVEEEQQV